MASIRKRGKVYYFTFTDADGVRVERKGCADKRVTEEMARAAESEAARARAGLHDPKSDAYRRHEARPLEVHLDDFVAYLEGKGNKPRYVQQVRSSVSRLIRTTGMNLLSDISPSRVQSGLKTLGASGLALQTLNHNLAHIKGFSRWLRMDGRVREDVIAHLSKFNVKTDRRHDRGVLSHVEFTSLLEAAQTSGPFRGLTGEDRVILYLVAAYTGLRASELASLTPSDFDLQARVVRVHAAYTKNGEEAKLPVRPDLVVLLESYLAARPAARAVWPGTWFEKAARMLRSDLEAAGVSYVDLDGRYRDFHSLRHRFGTDLAAANVAPKVAQKLMRHSTITLTLDRYTHVNREDEVGGLFKLPPIPSLIRSATSGEERQEAKVPAYISGGFAAYLPCAGDEGWQFVTETVTMTSVPPGPTVGPKPFVAEGFGIACQDLSSIHPRGLEPLTLSSED